VRQDLQNLNPRLCWIDVVDAGCAAAAAAAGRMAWHSAGVQTYGTSAHWQKNEKLAGLEIWRAGNAIALA